VECTAREGAAGCTGPPRRREAREAGRREDRQFGVRPAPSQRLHAGASHAPYVCWRVHGSQTCGQEESGECICTTHTHRPERSEIRECGSAAHARSLRCGAAVQAAGLASTAAEQEYALSPPNLSFPPLRVPRNAVARPVARHSTAVHVNIPPSPDLGFQKRYEDKSGKFGISVKFYVR
jgi:hypothetical protein